MFRVASLGGASYFITFIDDFSTETQVYFLKYKSHDIDTFITWKIVIEHQTRCYVKILRSHGGGEFTSNIFFNICKSFGIKSHATIPLKKMG